MNREQLLTNLQQSLQTLAGLPDPGHELEPLRRMLRGVAANLSQPRLRVGAFGITSSGKSTLINAFLGEPLLPEQSPPSSNVPVILRAGPRRSLTVHRQTPGAQPESAPATAGSLEALGTIDGNPENGKAIRLLELELPQSLIPQGIELEDSQGLGARTDRAAETQVRLESLPRADVLLYLLAAGRFSQIDSELFGEFHPDQPVICVITGADWYPAGQLDAAEQQVWACRPGTPVVRVNAKLAQHHAAPNWDSSGFPALLSALDTAIRQVWEARIQAAVSVVAAVAGSVRTLLGARLADARAAYDADKARHDQILQAQERLTAAKAELENEIRHLSQFTPINEVLEPVDEWLGRLQVALGALEPALGILQRRLDEVPASYRSYVSQRLTAFAARYDLRLPTIRFPEVPPPPGLTWPQVTLETRSAFGLLKQKTVMILMPELQELVERTVQAAVAPLQSQVAHDVRAWSEQVIADRMATWNRSLPEAAARLAAGARQVEKLAAVFSYWQPLGSEVDRVAAAATVGGGPRAESAAMVGGRPRAESAAMAGLVSQFRDLALPRLLLRAVHDVTGSGRTGRRRVLVTGADFARQWQLAQLLLRGNTATPAPPTTGLLWLQTPSRFAPLPFPCDLYPHPAHRLLDRIDLIIAAAGADPGAQAAAAHWADAVIHAAPAGEAAAATAAMAQASYGTKAILVLGEVGTQADHLPALARTLSACRHPVILHDGSDVRYTHFRSLLDQAETPANLVRLWRAWRLQPTAPFDPADLQGYFADIQAGRNGVHA